MAGRHRARVQTGIIGCCGVDFTSTLYSPYWAALMEGVEAAAGADGPVQISGIYPHLCAFNDEGECGTGAVVPWAGKLWRITYAPHKPQGSSDKLSEITSDRFLNWSGYGGPSFLLPNAIHLERYDVRPRNATLAARWGLDGARVLLTLGRRLVVCPALTIGAAGSAKDAIRMSSASSSSLGVVETQLRNCASSSGSKSRHWA